MVLVERRESERLLFLSTRRSSAVVSQGSLKSLELREGTWEPKIVSGISFSSMISISFKVDPLNVMIVRNPKFSDFFTMTAYL